MPTYEVDHDGANGVVGVRAEGCVCCADVAIREFPHIQRVVRFWFDLKPIFLWVASHDNDSFAFTISVRIH